MAAQAQESLAQLQLRAAYSSLRLQSRCAQVSKWQMDFGEVRMVCEY
jgi:hypothetical protein